MPAKSDPPRAQFHLSVFLNVGKRGRFVTFSSGSQELTPARMKLLAKLIKPDQWRRNLGSRPTTWEEVEASVAKALSSS